MYTIADVTKQENLMLAFNRLLTNPESTYKNYFRNIYSAYSLALQPNIEYLRKKIKSGYLPGNTIRVFMPKGNGLSRMYTLLQIEDQIVYQAYANVIAEALSSIPEVKRRYKKLVFGNLYAGHENLFFYQKWQDSYKAYTRAIIKSYEKGNIYTASFDLTACYDSINHHLLLNILKSKCHFSDSTANSFIQLIEKLESSSELELGTGIPQGPQASGIVAEAVLAEYDSYIESLQKKLSFDYFRYVDDIRILSSSEETVRWVLFLLDKKSKELGLFPQSSKISVHPILTIDDEIKRISKPLFEDEFSEKDKALVASTAIKNLLKESAVDVTSVKRYFQFVTQDAKTNKLAIMAVKKLPNMIHSFAYYVQRYPRKLPPTISNYIYSCCEDRTQQFAAGLLLEVAIDNLSSRDQERFLMMAKNKLNQDKKNPYIVDCRYKAALICITVRFDKKIGQRQKNYIKKCDWWVVQRVLSQAISTDNSEKFGRLFIEGFLKSERPEEGLLAAQYYLSALTPVKLPPISEISPYAQNVLKQAGLIKRGKYANSQINRYLLEITKKKIIIKL